MARGAATVSAGVPGQFRTGVLAGMGAYFAWGVLPGFFAALAPSTAWELIPWRGLFTLGFCAVLVLATRSWPRLLAIARDGRLLGTLTVSTALMYVNWQAFVLAASTGHVVEVSLGYFINPLVSVLLGVLFLRERLRPLQWAAVGVAAVAVIVLVAFAGGELWLAFVLALSFGLYGLVRNRVGARVDTVSGLTIETALLVPVAVVQLGIVAAVAGTTFGRVSPLHTVAVILSGLVTAVPLLLFGTAVRRLPLSLVGLIQFLAPILQFISGVFLMGESMPPVRWAGFAIVWAAIALIIVDGVLQFLATQRSRPAGRPAQRGRPAQHGGQAGAAGPHPAADATAPAAPPSGGGIRGTAE